MAIDFSNTDDLIDSYYSSALLSILLRSGAFNQLQRGGTVSEISNSTCLRNKDVNTILNYLISTTNIIQKKENKFQWSKYILDDKKAAFRLIKYLGAYPIKDSQVVSVGELPDDSYLLSSEIMLAEAFSKLSHIPLKWVADVVEEQKPVLLAEIGCGTAPVLRELLSRGYNFTGYALDQNSNMLSRLEELLISFDKKAAISVIHAKLEDVYQVEGLIPDGVDGFILRGVLNSFWSNGPDEVQIVLSKLHQKFPNAKIFVCDYIGQLNCVAHDLSNSQTLAQDLAQYFSGQGVPPGELLYWDEIYKAVGLHLVKREINSSVLGITQFLDVLSREMYEA